MIQKLMTQNLFEITNLKKKYGRRMIFNRLNLTMKKGETLALMGANGAGKTTLLDMICGLTKITGGKLKFNNRRNFFQNLGVQFQDGTYPFGIRVKDLIWLYLNVYRQKIDARLKKQFRIEKIENQAVNSLSFGERKRLELFLLLNNKNEILILDEITSGMDIAIQFSVVQCLKEYIKSHNISLIYVSHNFQEAKKLCNRIVMLGKKGIVLDEKIQNNKNLHSKIEKILLEEQKLENNNE